MCVYREREVYVFVILALDTIASCAGAFRFVFVCLLLFFLGGGGQNETILDLKIKGVPRTFLHLVIVPPYLLLSPNRRIAKIVTINVHSRQVNTFQIWAGFVFLSPSTPPLQFTQSPPPPPPPPRVWALPSCFKLNTKFMSLKKKNLNPKIKTSGRKQIRLFFFFPMLVLLSNYILLMFSLSHVKVNFCSS